MNDLPKISSILDGTITVVDRELRRNIAMGYAITISIMSKLREEYREIENPSAQDTNYITWCERYGRAFTFLNENFQPEFLMMAFLQSQNDGFRVPRPECLNFID